MRSLFNDICSVEYNIQWISFVHININYNAPYMSTTLCILHTYVCTYVGVYCECVRGILCPSRVLILQLPAVVEQQSYSASRSAHTPQGKEAAIVTLYGTCVIIII